MTVAVTTPPGTSPPDKYGGDPAAFDTAMQAHLTWQTAMIAGLNTQNAENNSINANMNAVMGNASVSAATATLQAQKAATNTNAPLWVSGMTYVIGTVVYSPSTYRTYRRKVTGAGSTDPATDSANWGLLTLDIDTLLPTVRPTYLADFVNGRVFDPRITFTRASTGTRTNEKGLMEVVPSGVPRIDFDPLTLECRGLLLEESRANMMIYSEQFDNAIWLKTRATVTANATTAPDGTVTADKAVEDSTALSTHVAGRQLFTSTAATRYTASIFAKAAERSTFMLLYGSNGAAFQSADFDLSAGTATIRSNSLAGSCTITRYPNGWYFCTLTVTDDTGGVISYVDYRLSSTAASNSMVGDAYTGNGASGMYFWGAQLEVGAFATSYIPTVASQVTRAADVGTLAGAMSTAEYTLACAVSVAAYSKVNVRDHALVSLDDGTTNNFALLRAYSGSGLLYFDSIGSSGGVLQFDSAQVEVSNANQAVGMAVSVAANNAISAINGGTPDIDTTVTMPVGATRLLLQSSNCHLRWVKLYNRALTASQVQALSTL